MKEIDINQSYELFRETLENLNVEHLNNSDDHVGYIYLEELDINVISFLHEYTVLKLLNSNLINEKIANDCLKLREVVIKLLERKNSILEIRNDSEWKETRNKAKHIIEEINSQSN